MSLGVANIFKYGQPALTEQNSAIHHLRPAGHTHTGQLDKEANFSTNQNTSGARCLWLTPVLRRQRSGGSQFEGSPQAISL
jgi:hypothetical protein